MTSTAISAQGSTLKIATGTASPISATAVAVGYPTVITATGVNNGDVVTAASFAGADAALLNGLTFVAKYSTGTKFAIDIDTTGKTITTSSSTVTPVTYTAVKNLKDFSGFDGSASDIDITNLDSTAKEFRAGLVDNGQFTVNLDLDNSDAGQLAVRAAQVAGITKNFKLTLPNGNVASFSGYVKKFGAAGGVDAVVKSAIDIKITGAITWA
jgi:hypothetical protein